MMKKWRCKICGYIGEGDSPPEICPVCGTTAEDFVVLEDIFLPSQSKRTLKKFIIIGGGPAGIEAAKTIRSHNKAAKIWLFSEESHLFYSRIHLSTFISDTSEITDITIYPQSWYDEQEINFRQDIRITEIHPKKRQIRDENNKTYSYDKLILAIGAEPFLPPIKGLEKKEIYSLRHLKDALEIRQGLPSVKNAVVVGGGILGIEVAAGLNKLGIQTHIIETLPFLMNRQLDEAGAAVLEQILSQRGLQIHLSQKVQTFAGKAQVEEVVLSSDVRIPTDMVIMTTGVTPRTDWLSGAGLNINRGIIVNEYMETNIKDIYAAGDVAEFQEQFYGIWPAAVDQGIIAGLNAAGITTEYKGTTPLHILKVAGLEMTSIGQKQLIQTEDREIIHLHENLSTYVKLIHDNDVLKGSITLGILGIGFRLERLIKNKKPISQLLPDFQDENWEILKKKRK
jgi:NAD(P)H-nitrite reductase large subunit/rubredoxin